MTRDLVQEVQDFLQPFISGVDSGYVGFTRADRDDSNHDVNKKWISLKNWFDPVENGEISLLKENFRSPHMEYYFTPAVLLTDSRLQNQFKKSNVIWVDFDTYVDWASFDFPPSIVVETSPGKFHCYWLLKTPITDVNSMRYWCRRFLTHYNDGDLSGFDATQLLKLPIGKNKKIGTRDQDGKYFSPRILKFNVGQKYGLDEFYTMPEPRRELPSVVQTEGLEDMPETDKHWGEYLQEHQGVIKKTLQEKVSNPPDNSEEKRSGVLYNVTIDLLEALGDSEKVFQVLKGSPVDKFSQDHGPIYGPGLLWKDINRIHLKQMAKDETRDISQRVLAIIAGQGGSREKGAEISSIILTDLKASGRFFLTREGFPMYADQRMEVPTIMQIEVHPATKFAGHISRRYEISPGIDSSIFKTVLHDILYYCQEQPILEIHHFAYYDQVNHLLYVDRYDGMMYVLDGEMVTLQPHGFQDVYFHNASDGLPKPYLYDPDYQPGNLDKSIFKGPNYLLNPGVKEKDIYQVLKTWVASFFFPEVMPTKPILVIYGEPDSGKTTMFQCISQLLVGDHNYAVTEIPKEVKDFNLVVSQSAFAFFDNVNINRKEMQEKISQASTGFAGKTRVLYTTNDMTTIKARAFLGITTFNLNKVQGDVTERYILIPVEPFDKTSGQGRTALGEILKNVADNRNKLWGELLDYVNAMVYHMKNRVVPMDNMSLRYADYVRLLRVTCDMNNIRSSPIEGYLSRGQSETKVENDNLLKFFRDNLDLLDNNKFYSTKDLYDDILSKVRRLKTEFSTSRIFATKVRALVLSGNLQHVGVGVEIKEYSKDRKYRFYPIEDDLGRD